MSCFSLGTTRTIFADIVDSACFDTQDASLASQAAQLHGDAVVLSMEVTPENAGKAAG